MKVEKYLIELENGEFAHFVQESDTEIHVISFEKDHFYSAEKMDKEFANHMFNELLNEDSSWDFYGKCLKPKRIRKVEIELFK